MRLLLIALFFEVGIVLTFVPWSRYWDQNFFADSIPLLHAFITNGFVRGAVSGLGLVNLASGAAELLSLFAARRSNDPVVTIRPSSPVEE